MQRTLTNGGLGLALVLAVVPGLGRDLEARPSRTVMAWQEANAEARGAPDQAEVEPSAGASPRAAMRGYLEACRAGDLALAATYLDLDAIPASRRAEEGPDLARRLKVVLDRKAWIDLDSLSADEGGSQDDGLPPELERVAEIATSSGPVDLLLRRGPEGGTPRWRFSASTVQRIPALYEEFGFGALGEILPPEFFDVRFLEVQLWQWVGLVVAVLVSYLLSWIIVRAAHAALQAAVARTRTALDDQLLDLLASPVRLLLALIVFAAGTWLLRLAAPAQEFLRGLLRGAAVVVLAFLFLRVVDVLSAMLRARLQTAGKLSALTVLPLGEKTVKVVLLGFAALAMLQNLGFNVTGVLAGLGIGGLAVALAAQKTVENLFGGVSLTLDQPVRVGDFCRYGDKLGTIEEIGLRTTRIRSLDRTVVSIPNADFAYLQLENFARRDKIRFATKLGLRYETTPDQLRWVLAEVRKLFLAHPKVDPEPGRVRFVSFGDYSLDLEIFAFVYSTDVNEYLAIQEDLLLRIMDIVNASGTGFAFPSSTTYLARDRGNDADRTKQSEQRVHGWREKHELPFPDYPPDVKRSIDDSLDYPPRGSALAART